MGEIKGTKMLGGYLQPIIIYNLSPMFLSYIATKQRLIYFGANSVEDKFIPALLYRRGTAVFHKMIKTHLRVQI